MTSVATISLSKPVATPADYAKLSFPLPDHRYVGLLACQRDPNLRELETLVMRCEKKTEPSVSRSNGKEKGKQKKTAKEQDEELWEIELLDTPLFPEGGGQASDEGTLQLLDNADAEPIQVKEVIRRHLAAVHMCTRPVPVNTRVLAKVNWTRRHDLCTQHTAQHVLSAVLEHHFKLPTLGWALSSYPNLSYVELPRCPSKEELADTERICNDLIVEGRRVRIEMDLLEDHNRPENLPDDYVGGGVARTVIIDDLDVNPCCGTHYHSLAPLQGIHVSQNMAPVRGVNTRVFFLAGPRVIAQLSASLTSLRLAGTELSCSNEDVAARARLLTDSYREANRKEKRMREEIAESVAMKLLAHIKSQSQEEPVILAHIREEDATNDVDFLSSAQAKLKEGLPAGQRYAIALGQVGNTASAPDGCVIVFGSEDDVVKKVADTIKKGESKLTKRLKGGGKGRWQGKIVEGRLKLSDREELEQLLRHAIA